jgi:predicted phosphohydrolase
MQRRIKRRCGMRAFNLTLVLLVALTAGCTADRVVANASTAVAGATNVYVAGDIADCGSRPPADAAAARTAALVPSGATVLAPGDLAYRHADKSTLEHCFEATWGRHRGQMLVAVGNHDYVDGTTRAVRDYFPQAARAASDDFFAYAMQPAAGWWLVVLDSNVAGESMRRQQEWLEQALAGMRADPASANECLAVMWHAPVYSSGLHRGSGEHMRPLWALIDKYQADLVLSGHEHFYERFGPLDAAGNSPLDGQAPRQFVVGTGGAHLYGFWKPPYRSEARVLRYGVLQLSLAPGSYEWRFIDVDGRARDAGTARCRAPVKSGNVTATAAASTARQ